MSEDHKAKVIEPGRADLRIEVADDGVFLGFFAADGLLTLVNAERVPALAAWAADRRAQVAKGVDAAR